MSDIQSINTYLLWERRLAFQKENSNVNPESITDELPSDPHSQEHSLQHENVTRCCPDADRCIHRQHTGTQPV